MLLPGTYRLSIATTMAPGRERTMQYVDEASALVVFQVRPPEARERAGEAVLARRQLIDVSLLDPYSPGRVGLGSRDLQRFSVDVGRRDGAGERSDELCPVAGAAGDLQNVAIGQVLWDQLTQPGEIGLALRLVVDALVFLRARGVIRGEFGIGMCAHKARPSKCLTGSAEMSTPSRQRTFTAAVGLPAGSAASANG